MNLDELEKIKKEFDIKATTLEKTRKQLRIQLKGIHPDRNHGEFNSQEQKDKYYRIMDAIAFIDEQSEKDTSLVKISEVPEIVTIIRELANRPDRENYNRRLSDSIERGNKSFKARFRFPRIASTTIALILSFIWFSPQTLSEHPILSRLFNPDNGPIDFFIFTALWLTCLSTTAMYWVITVRRENLREQLRKRFTSEGAQNHIFAEFLHSEKNHKDEEDGSKSDVIKFTSDELIYYILERENFIRGRESLIDEELAESLADIIIQRGLEKGIIEKDSMKSLSDIYIVKRDEIPPFVTRNVGLSERMRH